jgi:hypothetical protein
MKPEFKVEGDVLKIKAAESIGVDADSDGIMSVKGSIALELEADGSEVLEELFKSSSLLEKAKELIKSKLGVAL